MPTHSIPKEMERGRLLLELPQVNKGLAFSRKERAQRGLLGLLPYGEETLDNQAQRAYQAFSRKHSALEKHIYLRQLQNVNEILFFKLIMENSTEMLPIIYTPTVGDACKYFSEIYRKPQGLFLNYPERDKIDTIMSNVPNKTIEVVVVTDGEAILGIGDQGVGGMGIPIGKLCLYSAMGGINPKNTLPVTLDVGTNNEMLLNDSMYIGWRHERLSEQEYDDFVELALTSIHRRWPHAVIQFEDFGSKNSQRLLDLYIDRFCCFNDDIQGTAAVTLGSLVAACRATGKPLNNSKFVIVGAGSAGTGIANGLISGMVNAGMDRDSALQRIYMLDSRGLIHSGSSRIQETQKPFVRDEQELVDWNGDYHLLNTIRKVKPNVLIGVSGQGGFFTEQIVREMSLHSERPCIFPLSNPTSKSEALPSDILKWSDGRAIVATGSPFDSEIYKGTKYEIAQCNNAYAFPGLGLGLIAVKARRVTTEMLTAVAHEIGCAQPRVDQLGISLLPPLDAVRELSRKIAITVAKIAVKQGLNDQPIANDIEQMVNDKMWAPSY